MSKATSWKTATTHARRAASSVGRDVTDKWHVDRFPTAQTKSVKVAYGDLKVVKHYGKK